MELSSQAAGQRPLCRRSKKSKRGISKGVVRKDRTQHHSPANRHMLCLHDEETASEGVLCREVDSRTRLNVGTFFDRDDSIAILVDADEVLLLSFLLGYKDV